MTPLSTLRIRVQQKTGQSQATPDQLNYAINRSYKWVFSKLVDLYGANWFLTKTPFAITAGVQQYDLPADFNKLMRLENASGLNVEKIEIKQSAYFNVQQLLTGYPNVSLGYLLYGFNATTGMQQIYLVPSPANTETWTLYYNYEPVDLSEDTDTARMPSAYEEVLILYAASLLYEDAQNLQMATYYYNRAAGKLQEMINAVTNRNANLNPQIDQTGSTRYYDAVSP